MRPRNRDIICDAHVRIHTPPHLYLVQEAVFVHILGIYYVEHFLCLVLETFEDDEIFLRLFKLHNIYDFVIICDLERI